MCGTCGCSGGEGKGHVHEGGGERCDGDGRDHEHEHLAVPHAHASEADGTRTLDVGRRLLERNEALAERVSRRLGAKGVVALGLVSSPGSGKTALLERSLPRLAAGGLRCAVLVGDLATENDARRLRATGAPAVQITTGDVCHLDAHMVLHGLDELDLDALDVVFLENVGNLVCPAAFDLGEDAKVVLCSTPEGEDKPAKYPTIFDGAELVLVTKADLAEVLGFDTDALRRAIRDVAPAARVVEVSARTGQGIEAWLDFVREAARRKRAVSV